MRKNEFLAKLKEALEMDLSSRKVEEQVAFYRQYINEEIGKGRTEAEVLEELGDPWVISRNILSTEEMETSGEYVYEESGNAYERKDSSHNDIRVFQIDSWWKKALIIIAVLGILCLVFSIVTGIVRLIAPIAIPVILIILLVKIWKK